MSTEQIPAEAVEEREATPDEAHDIGYTKGHIDGYREAMAEVLATHHPARVLPSAEDVAEAACPGAHPTRWEHRSTASPCDHCRQGAPRVLALFAAAPTVQQVRAEALRDARDEMRQVMQDFPQQGRHTRAGWALNWLTDRARAAETEGA